MPDRPPRTWEVLLLGGASGTGKTRVAQRVARHFDTGLVQVDDFQVVLERVTTPEQQPALHFWRTHPDPGSLAATEIQRQGLDVLRVMTAALDAVIESRLESGTPVVLEGDFIDPSLVAQDRFGDEPNGGRVRGVFLLEDDEDELVRTFLDREPAAGPQRLRARVSTLWTEWLRDRCVAHGVPVVPARPWDTLFTRIVTAAAEG